MSRNNAGPGITLTIRKVSSGYKVVALQGEDMNHLYSIARILIRSPEYQRCYAVGTDWQGNSLFNVQPEQVYQPQAPYQTPYQTPQQPYPQMGYQQPQQPQYALPAYQQQAQPGNPYAMPPGYQAPPGYRAVPAYVEDAEVDEPYGVRPAYPALPGRR